MVINKVAEEFYTVWLGVLMRCYNKRVHDLQPTYIGCSICDDWKSLTKFKEWFDDNYVEGYSLDKDLLVNGNKVYGPNTCAFIPPDINNLLTESTAIRGSCMIGVTAITLQEVVSRNTNKHRIRYHPNIKGVRSRKGLTFDTELEAHLYWKSEKNNKVIGLLTKYPKLPEGVKVSLSNRYSGDGVYTQT